MLYILFTASPFTVSSIKLACLLQCFPVQRLDVLLMGRSRVDGDVSALHRIYRHRHDFALDLLCRHFFPFAAWRIASVRLAGIPMAAVSSRIAPTSIIGSNSSAYAGISLM